MVKMPFFLINLFFLKEFTFKTSYIKYKGGEIIRKYPFVKQRGIKDCGPACVQMILKYYHGYVNMDKLSEMMNTNQNGTTAYNIKETLNQLGFKSAGIKSQDVLNLKLPCIAHVIVSGSYKHYIVIYKVNTKRKTVFIADPATTLKAMSFQDFYQIWSGVTIQMRPVSKIVSEPEPKVLKFLFQYIKKYSKLVVIICLLSIIVSISSLLTSLFIPFIINDQNHITNLILVFSLLFLVKHLLSFFKNKLLLKFNINFEKELSTDIFKNILNLPYRYYRRKTTGEITSYFNDLSIIRNALNQFIQIVFLELPLILIISIIILSIDAFVFIITFISVLIFSLVTSIYQNKQKVWFSEMIRTKALNSSYIVESIMGFETIKNLNITPKISNAFNHKYQNFINVQKKLFTNEEKHLLLKNMLETLSTFLIVIFIIKRSNNDLTLFVTLFILSSLLISSFKNLLSFRYQINEVKSALSNITELTNKKSENIKQIKANGDIIITNLNYSFYLNNLVLKNINLKISKSSKVIITGDSGSGKSTLFKIIKGYYKDYQGSVKIGKHEIKNYNFSNIIYVCQKEILFTGTLEDNLNLKKKNLKNTKICEIDKFIKGNYYQIIEEDGFNLSGGQKQRIVLARALNDFDIIIIDEGLNQVSVDMERRILKNLLKAYRFKTIIYISHRLDNLDLFDKYIKLQKGQVVEDVKRNN